MPTIEEQLKLIEDIFERAAAIEAALPDRERRLLNSKCGWPEYVYDSDDRKDQEPEFRRGCPTPKEIDLLEKVLGWFGLLGTRTDKRTVTGKKIIWAKAKGFSYRRIAFISGVPPKTCENWYKQDIKQIIRKINIV